MLAKKYEREASGVHTRQVGGPQSRIFELSVSMFVRPEDLPVLEEAYLSESKTFSDTLRSFNVPDGVFVGAPLLNKRMQLEDGRFWMVNLIANVVRIYEKKDLLPPELVMGNFSTALDMRMRVLRGKKELGGRRE